MLSAFSSNVILTKARALYGKRLNEEQYQDLLHKKTVAEIAAYLRDETYYRETLHGIQPSRIWRGQLENLLKKDRFTRYLRLMHYDTGKEDSYYRYLVKEIEIEQILHMIRLLNNGHSEEFINKYPEFIEKFACFSFMELAKVRSFSELINVLKPTPYADLLYQYRPVGSALINYTGCEVALMSYFYKHLNEIINKSFSGHEKNQLNDIFNTHVELLNINNILRIKKFFANTKPEAIMQSLLPTDGRIPDKIWRKLSEAENSEKAMEILGQSHCCKYFGHDDTVFIEYDVHQIRYHLCRKYLRFSTDAATAFTAYMVLSEIEVANITMIIEAVRFGIAPSEIEKMIIKE